MINREISIIAYKKYRKYAKIKKMARKNTKWRENMLGYLSAGVVGSERRTVFRERRSSKKSPFKLLGLRVVFSKRYFNERYAKLPHSDTIKNRINEWIGNATNKYTLCFYSWWPKLHWSSVERLSEQQILANNTTTMLQLHRLVFSKFSSPWESSVWPQLKFPGQLFVSRGDESMPK